MDVGDDGSGVVESLESGSTYDTGVMFGAKVTGREDIPYVPAFAGVKAM